MTTDTRRPAFIGVAEVTAMIRRRLKASFPGVKFRQRSRRYTGGASITVAWDDGPVDAAVQAIVGQYQGSRFDGQIDLSYDVTHWLLPDLSTEIATDPGSTDHSGVIPREANWMPHPDAKLVQFGVRHVFTSRHFSAALLRRCRDRISHHDARYNDVTISDGFDPVINVSNDAACKLFDAAAEIYAAARRTHCVSAAFKRRPPT